MKKLLLSLMLVSGLAYAGPDCRYGVDNRGGCGHYSFNDHNRQHRPHPQAVWRDRDGWVLPAALFLGTVLAIEASRQPAPIVVETVPAPAPLVVTPLPYTLPSPPIGYHYSYVYLPECSCNKTVLVPN